MTRTATRCSSNGRFALEDEASSTDRGRGRRDCGASQHARARARSPRSAFAEAGVRLASTSNGTRESAVADDVIVGVAAVKVEDEHLDRAPRTRPCRTDRLGDLARSRTGLCRRLAGQCGGACGAPREGLRARSPLVSDGDRPGRRPAGAALAGRGQRPQLPRGRGPAVHETHMETFEDSWEHTHEPYDEWAHWMVERPGFDPDLWLLPPPRMRSQASRSAACTRPILGPAGSTSSAFAGPGGVRVSGGHSCSSPSAGSERTGAHAPFSASTRPVSPVRTRFTRMRA